MRVSSILVSSVTFKQEDGAIWKHMSNRYMKESDTPATNVNTKLQIEVI